MEEDSRCPLHVNMNMCSGCESSDFLPRNSLNVRHVPVTLSWQGLSVFTKSPRSRQVESEKETRAHCEHIKHLSEVNNHNINDDDIKVDLDEIQAKSQQYTHEAEYGAEEQKNETTAREGMATATSTTAGAPEAEREIFVADTLNLDQKFGEMERDPKNRNQNNFPIANHDFDIGEIGRKKYLAIDTPREGFGSAFAYEQGKFSPFCQAHERSHPAGIETQLQMSPSIYSNKSEWNIFLESLPNKTSPGVSKLSSPACNEAKEAKVSQIGQRGNDSEMKTDGNCFGDSTPFQSHDDVMKNQNGNHPETVPKAHAGVQKNSKDNGDQIPPSAEADMSQPPGLLPGLFPKQSTVVAPHWTSMEEVPLFVHGMPKAETSGMSAGSRNLQHSPLLELRKHSSSSYGHWTPLLRGVTGIVHPGTLFAVMGPSSAGKTTLIKALASRCSKGCFVTGKMHVNGVPVKDTRQISAYIRQDDRFLANLTVKETLAFRTLVELGDNRKLQVQRVVDILRDMELVNCANSLVGCPGTGKGISKAEIKRLSIGCEIIRNPPLIFCDEPTAGLEPLAAHEELESLLRLAMRQHTVVCTISQSSSLTFAYFHQILLLTEGRVAFLGTPSEALGFFTSVGEPCPLNVNPGDFFISTLSGSTKEFNSYTQQKAESTSKRFAMTPQARAVKNQIDQITKSAQDEAKSLCFLLHCNPGRQCNWRLEFCVHFRQFWKSVIRQKTRLMAWIFTVLLNSVLIGSVFFRLDREQEAVYGYDQATVLKINGALFVVSAVSCVLQCFIALSVLPPWIPICLHDYGKRFERLDAFYMAVSMAEIPLHIVLPILMVAIDYWMVGLHANVRSFLVTMGIVLFSANTTVSFGHFLLTAVGNKDLAMNLAGPIILPLLILAGSVVSNGSVPAVVNWLGYLSWFRQAYELLVVNQWSHVTAYRELNTTSNHSQSSCVFSSGSEVLEHLQLSARDNMRNCLLLAGQLILFRVAAFVSLFIRVKRYRE